MTWCAPSLKCLIGILKTPTANVDIEQVFIIYVFIRVYQYLTPALLNVLNWVTIYQFLNPSLTLIVLITVNFLLSVKSYSFRYPKMEICDSRGNIHIRIRLPECVVLSHVSVVARFIRSAIMGRQLIPIKWLFRSHTTRKSKDHTTAN